MQRLTAPNLYHQVTGDIPATRDGAEDYSPWKSKADFLEQMNYEYIPDNKGLGIYIRPKT